MEYILLFLPLLGSIIGYLGKSVKFFFSEIITSLLTSISAILSIIIFYNGITYGDYSNYKILEGKTFPNNVLISYIKGSEIIKINLEYSQFDFPEKLTFPMKN